MNKREALQLLTDDRLEFLDPKWDDALMGVADRQGIATLPVYSYRACKYLSSRELSPDKVFIELRDLFDHPREPHPAILHKPTNKEMWQQINSLRLPTWDQLNYAVAGILRRRYRDAAVAYDEVAAIRQLEASQADSEGVNPQVAARELLTHQILPVDLGPCTPFFLTFLTIEE